MGFLKGIIDRIAGTGPTADRPEVPVGVHLAAFGKHPGWDDHIDDLGVDTDRLVAVKRSLYLQGISGNLDTGTWEQLTPAQRLAQFDHVFIWQTADTMVVGRLAASTDGKGRGRYPMIVCAECGNMDLPQVVDEVYPRVSIALSQCRQATTKQEVIAIVRSTQEELRSSIQLKPRHSNANASLSELVSSPDLGPDGSKLLLVLYQIDREMSQYQLGDPSKLASRAVSRTAAHLRVPACSKDPAKALRLWLQFLSSRLEPTAPVLGIASVGSGWVDLVVGETQTQDFFSLLASRETIPFTTDIPYTLPGEFMTSASRLIAQYRLLKPAQQ